MNICLQVEAHQGPSDDTALNAIELVCGHPTRTEIWGTLQSMTGPLGNWTPRRMCDPGYYVTAFRLDVEPDEGAGDDTAANNLVVQCRLLNTTTGQYELDGESPTTWGRRQAWSESCPLNSAVCGLKTRVEAYQGDVDDTALNDVEMYCCKC